jgi:hypothetical protein
MSAARNLLTMLQSLLMNNENPNSGVSPQPISTMTKSSSKQPIFLVLLLTAVTLLAGGMAVLFSIQSANIADANKKIESLESKFKELNDINNAAKSNNLDKVEKDKFQAVFLTGGQVYFGKITNITDTQITLENIYYLRTNSKVDSTNVNNPPGDASLVKLGKEIHGPEDRMFIERKETVFWENLKPDGEVTKAIVQYEQANPQ